MLIGRQQNWLGRADRSIHFPAIIPLLTFILLATPAGLRAETLQWYASQVVPHVVFEGAFNEKGITQTYLAKIISKLTNFTHSIDGIPSVEIFRLAEGGKSICTVSFIATPAREQFLRFASNKVHILPPRLFVRNTAKLRAGLAETPELSAVIAAKDLIVGLVQKRSYGKSDEVIKAAPEGRIIFAEGTDALIFLAVNNQLDAFIAYAEETRYFMRLLYAEEKLKDFTSYALPGPAILSVPIAACTKGAWGDRIVPLIDAAFTEDVLQLHMNTYESWLGPAEIKDYRAALQNSGVERGPVKEPPT